MVETTLDVAVARIAEELRSHAAACLADPSDVGSVVRHGEAVRAAVLAYETILGDETGWSSPLRHLDDNEEEVVVGSGQTLSVGSRSGLRSVSVKIDARYYVRVNDTVALGDYVKGRFGYELNDATEIVRTIYKADGWDPEKYPEGLVRVDDVGIDAYIED